MRKESMGFRKIVAMKDQYGKEKRDKTEILNIITGYYKKLYEGEKTDININENETEEISPILKEEVEWAVKSLKDGKAGGLDRIVNEQLKVGGQVIVKDLVAILNKCIELEVVPKYWLEAKLILLFKKGDIKEITNYRPISLLPVFYKVLMKIVVNRIDRRMEEMLSIEQSGYRKNFSTSDNIHVIRELIRKAHDYSFSLYLLFVDFEKAFDSVTILSIVEALQRAGIQSKYINLFKYIYRNSSLIIEHEGEKEKNNSKERFEAR